MNNCKRCKFMNFDYIYDEENEEEYIEYSCSLGHSTHFSDEKCPFYSERETNLYVEQETKCDKCKYLKECIASGYVIRADFVIDIKQHYIPNIGVVCPL